MLVLVFVGGLEKMFSAKSGLTSQSVQVTHTDYKSLIWLDCCYGDGDGCDDGNKMRARHFVFI